MPCCLTLCRGSGYLSGYALLPGTMTWKRVGDGRSCDNGVSFSLCLLPSPMSTSESWYSLMIGSITTPDFRGFGMKSRWSDLSKDIDKSDQSRYCGTHKSVYLLCHFCMGSFGSEPLEYHVDSTDILQESLGCRSTTQFLLVARDIGGCWRVVLIVCEAKAAYLVKDQVHAVHRMVEIIFFNDDLTSPMAPIARMMPFPASLTSRKATTAPVIARSRDRHRSGMSGAPLRFIYVFSTTCGALCYVR